MVFDIPFQNESLFRYESLNLYVFRWKHEAMTKKDLKIYPHDGSTGRPYIYIYIADLYGIISMYIPEDGFILET